MVLIKEFRIVMPLSLEEYQVAQMYMVMRMQQQNTNSTEGVDVLENRDFDDRLFGKGRYTSKVYRLQSLGVRVLVRRYLFVKQWRKMGDDK